MEILDPWMVGSGRDTTSKVKILESRKDATSKVASEEENGYYSHLPLEGRKWVVKPLLKLFWNFCFARPGWALEKQTKILFGRGKHDSYRRTLYICVGRKKTAACCKPDGHLTFVAVVLNDNTMCFLWQHVLSNYFMVDLVNLVWLRKPWAAENSTF